MKRESAPIRLDVVDFTENAASQSGVESTANYPRLAAELVPQSVHAAVDAGEPPSLAWHADGERRTGADGSSVPWLHVRAEADVSLVCQRCLTPVASTLAVDRWFRFAADEATAEMEDELADEDVLVVARDFDLHGLIEDELLMEIPLTPRHDVCPVEVRLSAVDAGYEEGENVPVNPFAVLGTLRTRKPE
ncbi:MAG: YceD family protein [Janthinobacterium lividum]